LAYSEIYRSINWAKHLAHHCKVLFYVPYHIANPQFCLKQTNNMEKNRKMSYNKQN